MAEREGIPQTKDIKDLSQKHPSNGPKSNQHLTEQVPSGSVIFNGSAKMRDWYKNHRPHLQVIDCVDSTPRMSKPLVIKGLQNHPPREWLYGTCYGRGILSALAATGGTGKSMLVIAEALAIASGKSILGETPRFGPQRVWHVNLEDDRPELERRFEAAIELHGITQEDFGGRLFITGNEQRMIVASEGLGGFKIATPIVEEIRREIKRLQIDVLTVDPFVSTHAVSENSNDRISAVANLWRDIAVECNMSITLVHHMRKPASAKPGQLQTGFTVDDSRGAGAFKDAVRAFRVMNKLSETAANKLGLLDHWRYLQVTDGKGNYAPPVTAGKWFKLSSIGVSDIYPHGVGAVDSFELPNLVSGVDSEDIKKALATLQDGMARVDSRSPDWAGNRVAVALGTGDNDKLKLKALLGNWVKAGYLTVESRVDDARRLRDFYQVTGQPESDFEDSGGTDSSEDSGDE